MKISSAALLDYREQFVATLAHDLRGPLSAAGMAAHLIATAPADDKQLRAWAVTVERNLNRIDRMIADVADVNQLASGVGIALNLEACDVSAIATALASEMGARHGAHIKIETQGEIKGVWSSDALTRILENLLSNAVSYGDAEATITVRLRRREDRLLISVHNEGAPIAPEQQGTLFDAQAREKNGKRRQRWGLALVHGLVAAHGGIVNVASCLIDGTTFTVDLPVMPRAA